MRDVIVLVLLNLAVYRVTRLVVFDTIPVVARPVAWMHRYVHRRAGEDWAHGFECSFCVSVYIGGVLTLATALTAGLPVPWLVWPATSLVAGFLGYLDQLGALLVNRMRAGE